MFVIRNDISLAIIINDYLDDDDDYFRNKMSESHLLQ